MKERKVPVSGKVMLSGEYAVLHGGTAVLVPVPRKLEIIEINQPPTTPYPKAVEAARRFPIRELDDFEDKFGSPYVSVERSDFLELDDEGTVRKLGLGSSAAESVGVIALRFERAGIPWQKHRSEIARFAVESHRVAQDGKGSGADVAACALEKPVLFKRVEDKYSIEVITKTSPKGNIPMHLVWSRQEADTRVLVSVFDEWRKSDPASTKLIEQLVISSRDLAKAWFVYDHEDLFQIMDRFSIAMQQCAQAAGLQYKLPIHEELEAWALTHGGRAKPTGAGGGDMVLLVGDLPVEQLDELIIPLDFEELFADK